MTILGVVIPHL